MVIQGKKTQKVLLFRMQKPLTTAKAYYWFVLFLSKAICFYQHLSSNSILVQEDSGLSPWLFYLPPWMEIIIIYKTVWLMFD